MGESKGPWQNVDDILAYFGKRKSEAIKKYELFVAAAKNGGKRAEFTSGGLIRIVGGWKEAVSLRRTKENWLADERMLGDSAFVEKALKDAEHNFAMRDKFLRAGWTFDRLINKVTDHYHLSRQELKKKGRKNNIADAKSVIAYYANALGIKTSETAELFGCSHSTVTRFVHKGIKNADAISFTT
jgi:hypothetical protein